MEEPANWRCKKCGQTFADKPLGHGYLVVNIGQPARDEPCDGELEKVERS